MLRDKKREELKREEIRREINQLTEEAENVNCNEQNRNQHVK